MARWNEPRGMAERDRGSWVHSVRSSNRRPMSAARAPARDALGAASALAPQCAPRVGHLPALASSPFLPTAARSTIAQAMRLLNFLLPLLGATAALLPNAEAARKSSGTNAASARQSRFLADARANKGFVELDATSFNELTQTPRNYSVTALLTANAPSFRCQPCLTFQPEFEAVARAWQKNPSRDRHIFGKIEFMEGREIFRRVSPHSASEN